MPGHAAAVRRKGVPSLLREGSQRLAKRNGGDARVATKRVPSYQGNGAGGGDRQTRSHVTRLPEESRAQVMCRFCLCVATVLARCCHELSCPGVVVKVSARRRDVRGGGLHVVTHGGLWCAGVPRCCGHGFVQGVTRYLVSNASPEWDIET